MKIVFTIILIGLFWLSIPDGLFAQAGSDYSGPGGQPVKIGRGELTVSAYSHLRYTYTRDDKGGAGTNPIFSPIDTPDSIDLERLRLILYGDILGDLTYRFEYDLPETELKDAFFKIPRLPFYEGSLTLGQFKIPLSSAGLLLETPLQETIQGPLIYEKGLNTISDRETGLLWEGDMLRGDVHYGIGIFNGNGINKSDDNDDKDLLLYFKVAPWREEEFSKFKPLEFAAAFMKGSVAEAGIGSDPRERYTFSVKYLIEEITIASEYIYQILDADGPDNVITKDWYLQAGRDFNINFLKKRQPIRAFLRLEGYEPDSTVDDNEIKALTLGGNWTINQYARLMLNYVIYDEVDELDNNETLLQMEFKF